MSRAKAPELPQAQLSRFFKLFAPEYILGTTYTLSLAFFESAVYANVRDRSRLRKCVIICDQFGFQRASLEATALRGAAREYLVATAPATGSFHAKVWLMLAEGRMAALVGSGNLTQSGFMDNLELFEVLELEAGGDGAELAQDVARFVAGLRSLWGNGPEGRLLVVDALREIGQAVAGFAATLRPGAADRLRMWSSFDGPVTSFLKQRVNGGVLHVAVPYFGGSTAGLVDLQNATQPRLTRVYPAVHDGETVDLPIREAERLSKTSLHNLHVAAGGQFAHFKLYGCQPDNGQAWLFTGSVNCTIAALSGKNVEAGVFRPVAKALIDSYFTADSKSTLPCMMRTESGRVAKDWIIFWAINVGNAIELVPASVSKHLPLCDVRLELRAGSSSIEASLARLFDVRPARVPWKIFGEIMHRGGTRMIRLTATDASGSNVVGEAFVDDWAALTATPIHKSAFRASLAILAGDGNLEYSEISALFQLLEEVTPNGDDGEVDESAKSPPPDGSTEVKNRDKAPVWPPTVLDAGARLPVTGAGGGDLYWFNRILASLVHPTTETAAVEPSEMEDDGAESADRDEGLEPPTPAIMSGARKLWEKVWTGCESLCEKLLPLEVTEPCSRRIWGPAAFVLYSVLGAKRAIAKSTQGTVAVRSSAEIAQKLLSVLFSDRPQPEDYRPPVSSRYEHDVFPSLALDLADNFDVYPHCYLCPLFATAFLHLFAADKKTGSRHFSLAQWLLFREIAGDHLELAFADVGHLERLWEQYFDDPWDAVTWTEVVQATPELQARDWASHPGVQELRWVRDTACRPGVQPPGCVHDTLKSHLRHGTARHVMPVEDRFSDACPNPKCAAYGRSDPGKRLLRDLRPVICSSCGKLLVPETLLGIFKRLSTDGKLS